MSFLEALAYSLIHFEELLDTVRGTVVFLAGHRAGGKIEYTVAEAHLGELIVVEDEVLKLLNLLGFHNTGELSPNRLQLVEWTLEEAVKVEKEPGLHQRQTRTS